MSPIKLQKREETLLRQREKIDDELKKVRQQAKAETRKLDTKRKILAGSALLKELETGSRLSRFMVQVLDEHLTKPADREFFSAWISSEPRSGASRVLVRSSGQSVAAKSESPSQANSTS
jgi:hypothetical protein